MTKRERERRFRKQLGPKRVKKIRRILEDYVAVTEKKAWRLKFAEGILEGYLSGRIEYDFRKYSPGSHEFNKGQIIEGHFFADKEIMLLLEVLEDTKIKTFKEITKEEYRQWGVTSRAKMMEQMRKYYSGLKASDRAALNTLRLVRINNRPIAGYITDVSPV